LETVILLLLDRLRSRTHGKDEKRKQVKKNRS